MGCATSKNKVHVVSSSPRRTRQVAGDCSSTCSDTASQRGISATSKDSAHSGDSGFSDEYAMVITEDSAVDLVKRVESEFDDTRDLDLGLDGTGYRRLSRDIAEEARVMDILRSEGLIQRPVSRAAFGLSYDIISEESGFVKEKRPPARLAKLESRRKRRRQLTDEDIRHKLEKANERRKELVQERLSKIQAVTKTSDVDSSLDATAQHLQDVEQNQKTKEEVVIENRQRRLEQLQSKLHAKQEHAAMVRQRKKMATGVSAIEPTESTGNELTAAET